MKNYLNMPYFNSLRLYHTPYRVPVQIQQGISRPFKSSVDYSVQSRDILWPSVSLLTAKVFHWWRDRARIRAPVSSLPIYNGDPRVSPTDRANRLKGALLQCTDFPRMLFDTDSKKENDYYSHESRSLHWRNNIQGASYIIRSHPNSGNAGSL